jgi:hypothetical protein
MTTADIDAERQFLGCLMHLPLGPARRLLAGMRPGDMADPTAAFILALAIGAVTHDQPPTPVVLLDHAQETADRPRATRLHQVAMWIIDTHHAAPLAPEMHPLYLTAAVLKNAWRRAIADHAHRLLQAVTESPTHDLHQLATDTTTADELWQRYQATAGESPARLGVVA